MSTVIVFGKNVLAHLLKKRPVSQKGKQALTRIRQKSGKLCFFGNPAVLPDVITAVGEGPVALCPPVTQSLPFRKPEKPSAISKIDAVL
jgi:hypothetical protein